MPANLKNSAVDTRLQMSVLIPIPKKAKAKEWLHYHTIAFISYASTLMLKIPQARLQQYVNQELPDVQAEEPEIKLPTSTASEKKQEHSASALLTMPKHLTVWITTNCGKF